MVFWGFFASVDWFDSGFKSPCPRVLQLIYRSGILLPSLHTEGSNASSLEDHRKSMALKRLSLGCRQLIPVAHTSISPPTHPLNWAEILVTCLDLMLGSVHRILSRHDGGTFSIFKSASTTRNRVCIVLQAFLSFVHASHSI